MTDATERLAEIIGWTAAEDLLADPDLLVDLALEAGGLEQVGWLAQEGALVYPEDGGPDRGDQPVYRRKVEDA